jgi:anti-anti-sigma regulatory factor
MLRITRVPTADATTLMVSGRIDAAQLTDLRRSVDAEQARDLVLDLKEVSLVDVQVVRYLLRCERRGVHIAHCPAYIREWMVREKTAT